MRIRQSIVPIMLSCSMLLLAAPASAGNDDALTAQVKAALVAAAIPAAPQLQIKVFNGAVDLSGTVDSADSKAEASRVASTVKGVTSVRNDLEVREP